MYFGFGVQMAKSCGLQWFPGALAMFRQTRQITGQHPETWHPEECRQPGLEPVYDCSSRFRGSARRPMEWLRKFFHSSFQGHSTLPPPHMTLFDFGWFDLTVFFPFSPSHPVHRAHFTFHLVNTPVKEANIFFQPREWNSIRINFFHLVNVHLLF